MRQGSGRYCFESAAGDRTGTRGPCRGYDRKMMGAGLIPTKYTEASAALIVFGFFPLMKIDDFGADVKYDAANGVLFGEKQFKNKLVHRMVLHYLCTT